MRVKRRTGDDGVVAVLFGIFLLAFLGIGVIIVDLGLLYVEGRQNQNGAENAALAAAQQCASAAGSCTPSSADALAKAVAGENPNDKLIDVPQVCGTAIAVSCGSDTNRPRYDCRTSSGTAPFVQVRTSTKRDTGASGGDPTVIPVTFYRAFDASGTGVGAGSKVHACARAAFGSPAALKSDLPITMSACEWYNATHTSSGTVYAPPPPYPPWPSYAPTKIFLHGSAEAGTTCPSGFPSGGFGWIDVAKDDDTSTKGCESETSVGGTLGSSTGNSAFPGCKKTFADMVANQTPIYMPVFTAASGSGTGATYTIAGYAAFVMTGYDLPGGKQVSAYPGSTLCSVGASTPGAQCIEGYFTKAELEPSAGPPTAPSYGASVVGLVG